MVRPQTGFIVEVETRITVFEHLVDQPVGVFADGRLDLGGICIVRPAPILAHQAHLLPCILDTGGHLFGRRLGADVGQQDGHDHVGTFQLLDLNNLFHLFGRKGKSRPVGHQRNAVGNPHQAGRRRGPRGVPAAEPAEGDWMALVGFPCTQVLVIGCGLVLREVPRFGFGPVAARDKGPGREDRYHQGNYLLFHITLGIFILRSYFFAHHTSVPCRSLPPSNSTPLSTFSRLLSYSDWG